MFCTNCGTKFEGKFCSNCGTPVANVNTPPAQADILEEDFEEDEEDVELLVFDGTQELSDAAGFPLDLQLVCNAYKDEPAIRKFLVKYTNYKLEEINVILPYVMSNFTPEQLNILKRGALQMKLTSNVESMRVAQEEDAAINKKNAICCPRCNSSNVQISLEQTGTKTDKKKNSILRSAARGTMIVGTGGLWALTPKADGKEKSKTNHATFGICQDCGNSWPIKK